MSYYFHPSGEAEHFETIAFFESRQRGLGASYLSESEELMTNVIYAPIVIVLNANLIFAVPHLIDSPLKSFFVILTELFKFSPLHTSGVDLIIG